MLRTFVVAILALVICVGGLLAADGVVTKADKDKVTIKVDGKDKEVSLTGVKITGADGKEAKADALKKDTKVELVEKDGKVTEIKIKAAGGK